MQYTHKYMILLLYFFCEKAFSNFEKKIEIDNRQFLIDVNASQHSEFSNLLGVFFSTYVMYHNLPTREN